MSQKIFRVSDVMRTNIAFIDGMDTVDKALSKMRDEDTNVLIVNKRDEEDEFGVVMVSDISRKVLAKDRPASRVNIYEIMTKPIITVSPDMNIKYCSRFFEKFRLSRAPVLKNDKIVGLVSFRDMVINGMTEDL